MLKSPQFDARNWSRDNFQHCDLGDGRRSKRLEKLGQQAAKRPAASLPKMGENWGGVKGIYRLLDRSETTLDSVTETHRREVTQHSGRFLIVSDTTHVDYGKHRDLEDAGPVGPGGKQQGFLLHSGLSIDAEDRYLVGLAGQVAHVRPRQRRGRQHASQRLKRWRESEIWPELFEQVGSPPKGSEFIHVCDSAADNYEAFCTAKVFKCDFVIRVGRMHRRVVADGVEMPLSEAVSGLSELGRYELEIRQGNGRKARTAVLRVCVRPIQLCIPRHRSHRVRQYANAHGDSMKAWALVVEEVDPPAGAEPICWVLLTTVPIESFEEAWEVVSWYEERWLIEEWHKALKSGCRLEARQLQRVERLLPLTGVLSVVAVLLIQLQTAARKQPDQPASKIVPALWLQLLKAKKKIKTCDVTNYEFWRAIAKLGGFLGRRHDREPGWQLIWRGWKELHTLAEGASLMQKSG